MGCVANSDSYNSSASVIVSGQAEKDLNAQSWEGGRSRIERVRGDRGDVWLRAVGPFGSSYGWRIVVVCRWRTMGISSCFTVAEQKRI